MILQANTAYVATSNGTVSISHVPAHASGIIDIIESNKGFTYAALLRNRSARYRIIEGSRFAVHVQPIAGRFVPDDVGIDFDGDAVED